MCEYQFEFDRLYETIDELRNEITIIQNDFNELKLKKEKLQEDYDQLLIDYNDKIKESNELKELNKRDTNHPNKKRC